MTKRPAGLLLRRENIQKPVSHICATFLIAVYPWVSFTIPKNVRGSLAWLTDGLVLSLPR